MPPRSPGARNAILDAALAVLREKGAGGVTIEGVAHRAGCAKGLVHYHLKTKAGLLEAAAHRLHEARVAGWSQAFRAPTPNEAIRQSWTLLVTESRDGTTRAWHSLMVSNSLTGQTASTLTSEFAGTLGAEAQRLVRAAGFEPSVGAPLIGWFLSALVEGMGMALLAGGERSELEEAYAAAWLALLSLTEGRS